MTPQPEDRVPLTASPDMLVDAWGETRYIDLDDPDLTTYGYWNPDIGPATWDLLSTGLVNAQFAQGPPDESELIGTENPLPGWRLTKESGACDIRYATDAVTGEDVIEFTVRTASDGDDFYFEQIVPASPGRQVLQMELRIGAATGTLTNVYGFMRAVPLNKAGTEIGSVETIALATSASAQRDTYLLNLPSTTRAVKVRFGARVDGGASTGTTTFAIRTLSLVPPMLGWMTLLGSSGSTTDALTIYPQSDGLVATGLVTMPLPGWISSFSVKLSGNVVGGGSLVFEVVDGSGTPWGPSVTIATGASQGRTTSEPFEMTAGTNLRFYCTHSGTVTSTTLDLIALATVALILPPLA